MQRTKNGLIKKHSKYQNKDIQAQYLVFRVKDNKFIGILHIRHSLHNKQLQKYAGHIGYSVAPLKLYFLY